MRTHCLAVILLCGVVWAVPTAPLLAENEGAGDLDRATLTKLSAKAFSELGDVIRLCRSALDKGLDEGNT